MVGALAPVVLALSSTFTSSRAYGFDALISRSAGACNSLGGWPMPAAVQLKTAGAAKHSTSTGACWHPCPHLTTNAQAFNWEGAHIPLVPGLRRERGARSLEAAVWAELDVQTFTTVGRAARLAGCARSALCNPACLLAGWVRVQGSAAWSAMHSA